jgi:hypothetical protein
MQQFPITKHNTKMIELTDYQKNEMNRACEMASAPSTHLRPRLFPDGNRWCALYGESLQEGMAGFGKTPEGAMADFDYNFRCQTLPNAEGVTQRGKNQ